MCSFSSSQGSYLWTWYRKPKTQIILNTENSTHGWNTSRFYRRGRMIWKKNQSQLFYHKMDFYSSYFWSSQWHLIILFLWKVWCVDVCRSHSHFIKISVVVAIRLWMVIVWILWKQWSYKLWMEKKMLKGCMLFKHKIMTGSCICVVSWMH